MRRRILVVVHIRHEMEKGENCRCACMLITEGGVTVQEKLEFPELFLLQQEGNFGFLKSD